MRKWKWNVAKYGEPYSEFVLCNYVVAKNYVMAKNKNNVSICCTAFNLGLNFSCLITHTHTHLCVCVCIYSGYGKYSDPLTFFTLCYIAAIC